MTPGPQGEQGPQGPAGQFVLIKNGKVYSVGEKKTITVEAIKDVYKVDVEIIEFKGNKVIIL